MFLDRSRKAGPRLEWKVRAFVVAAVLGIAGIYFEERWMTISAILVLVAGLALRLTPRGGESDEAEGADDEEGDDEEGDDEEGGEEEGGEEEGGEEEGRRRGG